MAKKKLKQVVKQVAEIEPVFTPTVRLIKALNIRQDKYLHDIPRNDFNFGIGAAGTGKTFLAAAKAIDALKSNQIAQIILTRPYIPAGESLGFLPGTVDEKIEPYLEPFKISFTKRVGKVELARLIKTGQIVAKPFSFLQGITIDDAWVLADEIENATLEQIKLLLTRMGDNCKMILTGDPEQTYIRNSGLLEALRILKDVPKLAITQFFSEDCVRSEGCKHILEAFEAANKLTGGKNAR
jgi:phosphate starvation-inducible PhoH-like protein